MPGESELATLDVILKSVGTFIYHVAPPVLGVMIAGFFFQRYWTKRANESVLIEYLSKELSDLVDETLEYWSLDCSGTGKEAEQAKQLSRKLAPRIKAASHNLSALLRSYSEKYCKNADFVNLMAEVHDACTGGQFDGVKRAADPDRFMRVVSSTHRVRWKLFERRV